MGVERVRCFLLVALPLARGKSNCIDRWNPGLRCDPWGTRLVGSAQRDRNEMASWMLRMLLVDERKQLVNAVACEIQKRCRFNNLRGAR
jgi:hypothetical protein